MSQASRIVELDDLLYPESALGSALAAYSDYCDVSVAVGGSSRTVQIVPRPGTPETTADEFLSYLLGAALEIHLKRRSAAR